MRLDMLHIRQLLVVRQIAKERFSEMLSVNLLVKFIARMLLVVLEMPKILLEIQLKGQKVVNCDLLFFRENFVCHGSVCD